jgi:hypothetical protein
VNGENKQLNKSQEPKVLGKEARMADGTGISWKHWLVVCGISYIAAWGAKAIYRSPFHFFLGREVYFMRELEFLSVLGHLIVIVIGSLIGAVLGILFVKENIRNLQPYCGFIGGCIVAGLLARIGVNVFSFAISFLAWFVSLGFNLGRLILSNLSMGYYGGQILPSFSNLLYKVGAVADFLYYPLLIVAPLLGGYVLGKVGRVRNWYAGYITALLGFLLSFPDPRLYYLLSLYNYVLISALLSFLGGLGVIIHNKSLERKEKKFII